MPLIDGYQLAGAHYCALFMAMMYKIGFIGTTTVVYGIEWKFPFLCFQLSYWIGKKAEKILTIAKEEGISVVEDAPLVDFLGIQDVGDYIPEETWSVVAKIFAFIVDSKNGVNNE